MAALVSVYREGTQNLLFNRIYPDAVDIREANSLVGKYLEEEGFNEFFGLERRTKATNYAHHVLGERVLFGRVSNDHVLHVAKDDSNSMCSQPITGLFLSDIRYKEICDVCRKSAFI